MQARAVLLQLSLAALFSSGLEPGLPALAQTARVKAAVRHGCAPIVIEGELRAGEPLRRSIGHDLDLLLDPRPNGWILRVVPVNPAIPAAVDWAELATPPFRSVNPLLLTTDFGFRAQDVVGWNPRRFHFLVGREEAGAAERAYRAVLAGPHPSLEQESAVASAVAGAHEGSLEILDARLVPGTADQAPAASLVATHFLTTAHTIAGLGGSAPGAAALGRVEALRIRVRLSDPSASVTCSAPIR